MTADETNDWISLEAKEIRLWVGDPEMGLWCDTCALPSAWRAPARRDPALPAETWVAGCTDCQVTQ